MSRERSPYHAQLLAAAETAVRANAATVHDLAQVLYDRWYAPAAPEPVRPVGAAQVIAHLRAADAAGGRFDPGWLVVDSTEATARTGPPASPWQVAATRGAELRWVDPVDFVFVGQIGVRPPVGAELLVSRRRDSTALLPGWWTTFSPAWPEHEGPLVRLYWSVRPAWLGDLVRALTTALVETLPACLKCPVDLARCLRPDGVVLYLPAAAWPGAKEAIRTVHREIGDSLRPRVPALTLELAPGLALAEDPADDSFGMQRCRLLAGAFWSALAAGRTSELAAAAAARLRQAGILPEAPYLGANSRNEYRW
jgi:hypothetical protein